MKSANLKESEEIYIPSPREPVYFFFFLYLRSER